MGVKTIQISADTLGYTVAFHPSNGIWQRSTSPSTACQISAPKFEFSRKTPIVRYLPNPKFLNVLNQKKINDIHLIDLLKLPLAI